MVIETSLDLVELVLAQHAAGVLAGGAGLGAEARGERGDADGQFVLVADGFTHEIGQRHLGRGDEPEAMRAYSSDE